VQQALAVDRDEFRSDKGAIGRTRPEQVAAEQAQRMVRTCGVKVFMGASTSAHFSLATKR
jgi:hypothetical protein